jgi:uncharacterized protein (TIGR00645 family)
MDEPRPSPAPKASAKHAAAEVLELWLFRSRWLIAPFYVGLVVALLLLLYVFIMEVVHALGGLVQLDGAHAILMALSLIDLSLAGNLLLIVIFSGYENFISRIETGRPEDRPSWMGSVDFSGLKMKLMGSIVAISAIALLRAFMQLADNEPISDRTLTWLVVMHLTFVASGALLGVMDWISSKTKPKH